MISQFQHSHASNIFDWFMPDVRTDSDADGPWSPIVYDIRAFLRAVKRCIRCVLRTLLFLPNNPGVYQEPLLGYGALVLTEVDTL